MNAKKGDWVKIHRVIFTPDQRAPQVPDDTKKVPLEMWVKGFIDRDANVGDSVEITTITGRREHGTLLEVEPTYRHSFGNFVPEILAIGIQLKEILFGGDADER